MASNDLTIHGYPAAEDDGRPEATQPTGRTDHLDTVEWWKENYRLAIEVGQAKINAVRNVHRRRVDDSGAFCAEDARPWPCATIVALDRAGQQGVDSERSGS